MNVPRMHVLSLLSLLSCLVAAQAGAAISSRGASIDGRAESCPIPTGIEIKRKSYAGLTEQERQTLKSAYENMGERDEPPYPVDGLAAIDKDVLLVLAKSGLEGAVSLGVAVNSDGVPESVSVYATPAPELAAFIGALLMKQKFKPALCNCYPCRQEFSYQRTFTLSPVR